MLWVIIGIIVLIVIILIFVVVGFNKLRKADVQAQEALGGIDVQLTRRNDLIPNLVETVKGYASHERGVFDEVTAARAATGAAIQNGTVEQKAIADQAMENALIKVMAVAEAYPDLKASTNFLNLQQQLQTTEDQLAFARQYYNDAVSTLNTLVVTIPWMLFNGMAKVAKRDFYKAPEGQTNPPAVNFS